MSEYKKLLQEENERLEKEKQDLLKKIDDFRPDPNNFVVSGNPENSVLVINDIGESEWVTIPNNVTYTDVSPSADLLTEIENLKDEIEKLKDQQK